MAEHPYRDLIPFYVAETLSVGERQSFERHLATCESCRAELSHWRTIAGGTWRYAEQVSRLQSSTLPPSLMARLEAPTAPLPAYARRNERLRHPMSGWLAVASLLVVMLFAGVLVTLVRRQDPQLFTPPSQALDEDFLAMPRNGVEASHLEASTLGQGSAKMPEALPTTQENGIAPTMDGAFGILSASATSLPSSTPAQPNLAPTLNARQSPERVSSLSPSPTPFADDSVPNCFINASQSVPVYASANRQAAILTTMQAGEQVQFYVQSAEGWYQYFRLEPYTIGWVAPEDVRLSGACANLWLATPTLSVLPNATLELTPLPTLSPEALSPTPSP